MTILYDSLTAQIISKFSYIIVDTKCLDIVTFQVSDSSVPNTWFYRHVSRTTAVTHVLLTLWKRYFLPVERSVTNHTEAGVKLHPNTLRHQRTSVTFRTCDHLN